MKVRARARTARRGGAASLRLPFGLVRSPSGSKKARGAGASASAAGQTHADGVGGRRDVEARRDVVGAARVYVEHLMRMNRLLARAVRGAQDTNRELVAMGSRILALHEAGEREPAAARVDLASSLTAAAQAWAPQTPSYSPVANGGMQHAGGTVYYCTTTQEESERGATDASESDTAPALVSPTAMEDTVGNTVGDSAGEAAGVARAPAPAAKLPKRKAAPVPAVAPARAAPPPPRAAPPPPRAALSPPQPAPPPQQQPAPPSAEPPALSPGQLVRISGLSQRAELNGRTAIVVQWEGGDLRRYTVELAAPFTNGLGRVVRKLKLHPGNVAAAPG